MSLDCPSCGAPKVFETDFGRAGDWMKCPVCGIPHSMHFDYDQFEDIRWWMETVNEP
jgi:hypothetical protein